MNKKIKIIDLANIIAKNQDIPQRIKVDKDIYIWDTEEFYKREDGNDLFNLVVFYNTIGFLELEVEILEDNTEEIEEIGEYCDLICMTENEKVLFNMIKVTTHKVDELVRTINQIRKDKNND